MHLLCGDFPRGSGCFGGPHFSTPQGFQKRGCGCILSSYLIGQAESSAIRRRTETLLHWLSTGVVLTLKEAPFEHSYPRPADVTVAKNVTSEAAVGSRWKGWSFVVARPARALVEAGQSPLSFRTEKLLPWMSAPSSRELKRVIGGRGHRLSAMALLRKVAQGRLAFLASHSQTADDPSILIHFPIYRFALAVPSPIFLHHCSSPSRLGVLLSTLSSSGCF